MAPSKERLAQMWNQIEDQKEPDYERAVNNLIYRVVKNAPKVESFHTNDKTCEWYYTIYSRWKHYVNLFVIKFKRD